MAETEIPCWVAKNDSEGYAQKEADPELEKLLLEEEAIEANKAVKESAAIDTQLALLEEVKINCFKCGYMNSVNTEDMDKLKEKQCLACHMHIEKCETCCVSCTHCPCAYQCAICGACRYAVGCGCCHDCQKTKDECECEKCDDCGVKVSHGCSCNRHGKTKVAPWEERDGVVIRQNDSADAKYTKIWGLNTKLDMIAAMAEFYVLFGLTNELVNTQDFTDEVMVTLEDGRVMSAKDALRWFYSGDMMPRFRFNAATDTARNMFHDLVMELDDVLQRYVNCAVGGELRYHRAIGGTVLPSSNSDGNSRYRAWVGWKEVFDKVGPRCLADAAKLFREIGRGGIGGERWAKAAELLYWRLTDRQGNVVWHDEDGRVDPYGPKPMLPPQVFVDRVFNAQHNGGILLNKVNWPARNVRGWGIHTAKTHVLPAHDPEDGSVPDWPLLVSLCNYKVRNQFHKVWDAANALREQIGLERIPNPITDPQYRIMCAYCHSNPERGHELGCSATMHKSFNGGKIHPFFRVDSKGHVTHVGEPNWVIKVVDNEWPNHKWMIWKKKSYPVSAEGVTIIHPKQPVKVFVRAKVYDNPSRYLIKAKDQTTGLPSSGYVSMTMEEALDTTFTIKDKFIEPTYYKNECTLEIYLATNVPMPRSRTRRSLEKSLLSIVKQMTWDEFIAIDNMSLGAAIEKWSPQFRFVISEETSLKPPTPKPQSKPLAGTTKVCPPSNINEYNTWDLASTSTKGNF